MEITIRELVQANSLLETIRPVSIKVEDLKKLVVLKKELKKEVETAAETQDSIFKKYGIDQVNRNVDKHPNKDNINKEISELYQLNIEIDNVNFLAEGDFYELMKNSGLTLNQISFLENILKV